MATTPTPYKAKNGTVTYQVRFRLKPGTNPVKETFSTLEAAQKFARLVDRVGGHVARQMRQASDRGHVDTPTLRTQLETYLRRIAAHATPGTVADYRRMAERTWLPRLGEVPIDELTKDEVADWITWQRKQETARSVKRRTRQLAAHEHDKSVAVSEPVLYSAKSIANAQGLLSSVLQDALEAEHPSITRNVAKGVRLPTDAEREEMVFLTPAEFAAIYRALPEYWQPFVALLAGTGMRWGEVTALYGADFDLEAAQPYVTVSRAWKKGEADVYLGGPKSRRARRTVTLAPATVEAIRDRVEAAGHDGLVFTAREGGRIRAQNFHPRVWHRAVAASGIGKRPRVYDLRHSHISQLNAREQERAARTPVVVCPRASEAVHHYHPVARGAGADLGDERDQISTHDAVLQYRGRLLRDVELITYDHEIRQ